MFNRAIRGTSKPTRLSADHDPLYRFHQWHANPRVLRVTDVKSVPYVPVSHPFIERLIGPLRRECVDRMLFWSASDLEHRLEAFQDFYTGISDLLAPNGPFVHPRAAERTKFCSWHNRPTPEAVPESDTWRS